MQMLEGGVLASAPHKGRHGSIAEAGANRYCALPELTKPVCAPSVLVTCSISPSASIARPSVTACSREPASAWEGRGRKCVVCGVGMVER